MRIAFIRPSMFGRPARDAMQPLIFALIKAITPEDIEIIFYDELVEKLPGHLGADAVAITVDTFSARRAYQLASRYREQGSKVIMGGFHPTMMPEECLEHADAVVIGEAEDTWQVVLEDLKENKLKDKYFSRNNTDLSGVGYDHSVFKGKKYNGIGLVQFGRGCRFSCDFCSIHAFYKDSVRCRDIAAIVDEIRQIEQKYIFFIDDNLFADTEKARQLFSALIPLHKKWFCQISIDAAGDRETLKLMKMAGCILVLIGFESLNVENLRMMRKSANIKHSNYPEIISNIYRSGLMIYGTFIIGYDDDTVASVRETVAFAIDNKFAIANFNPLMPMPGTPLYRRMQRENRLLHDRWWLDDHYRYGDAMLVSRKMTAEQLQQACKNGRAAFSSYKSICQRLLGSSVNRGSVENLAAYLSANLISRQEIISKQGRKLGGEI